MGAIRFIFSERSHQFSRFVLTHLQRVEHQPAEQFRIEIRRFRRHLFEVAGDLLDVLHRRRRHQHGQLALLARPRRPSPRAADARTCTRVCRPAPAAADDRAPATCRMLTARPRQAGLWLAARSAMSCGDREPRRLPDAVGHRAEAEQILRAVRLDRLPGVAGALLARADALDLEVLRRGLRPAGRRSGRGGRRRAGASAG